MEMLELSLDRNELPVKLSGKTGTKNYVLREMDGNQRDAYLSEMQKHMELQDGKVIVTNYKGLHAMLLSLCLYEKDELVPVDVIQSLPSTAQGKLFEKAQILNGLNLNEAQVKND